VLLLFNLAYNDDRYTVDDDDDDDDDDGVLITCSDEMIEFT
jgi:hypothetical protein